MRVEFKRSLDFNQMLVVSAFVHLFAMAVILFLPKPVLKEINIVPAFRVELVELATGTKASAPPARSPDSGRAKPVATKTAAPSEPVPAKPSKHLAAKPERVQKILKELEMLSASNSVTADKKKSLLQELDQLASLSPKVPAKKHAVKKKGPIVDETFIQKRKKSLKQIEKANGAPPPVMDQPLRNYDQLKMEEKVKPVIEATEKEIADNKEILQEPQVAALRPKPSAIPKGKPEKSATDLLEELQQMAKLEDILSQKPPVVTPSSPKPTPSRETPGDQEKLFDPLREKLASLGEAPLNIDIDIVSQKLKGDTFKSGIRKLKIPAVVPSQEAEGESFVYSAVEGPPGADFLSLYIGEIYNKVYSKWKTPLGARQNLVIVAFTIFPKGNIDKPHVRKSAGDENLDTMAMRAVLDAEPFPPLPRELKVPNLRVNIHFKYVPEK